MLSNIFTKTFLNIFTRTFLHVTLTRTFLHITFTSTFLRIAYLYFNMNEDVTYILIKFHIHFIQWFKLQGEFNTLLFEWSKWIIILGGSSSITNQLRIVFTLTNQLFVFFQKKEKGKTLKNSIQFLKQQQKAFLSIFPNVSKSNSIFSNCKLEFKISLLIISICSMVCQ